MSINTDQEFKTEVNDFDEANLKTFNSGGDDGFIQTGDLGSGSALAQDCRNYYDGKTDSEKDDLLDLITDDVPHLKGGRTRPC